MTERLKINNSRELENNLKTLLSAYDPKQVFVLCDSNSSAHCLPLISGLPCLSEAMHITIPAGDENKNIDTLTSIWSFLSNNGGTRKSLLINLGGGMITDMGGFAAACFKRGITQLAAKSTNTITTG